MRDEWLLTAAIAAPLLAGLVSALWPARWVALRTLTALVGPALAFGLILVSVPAGLSDASLRSGSAWASTGALEWVPALHLNFAYLLDGLGTFFGLLVAGIGCLIVLYARGYFGNVTEQARADLKRFYPTLGFFASAMLGLVLADSTLLTVAFWELTSISSFLLIGWDRYDKGAVKMAVQAFCVTGMGGMFLLGGVLLLGAHTGQWRWSEMLAAPPALDGTMTLALALMLVGACAKSAQWPLHFWLPGAMAAPTPVSAYLHSATMVKAGVFLVGRLYPVFQDASIWVPVLCTLGTVTMFYGALMAVTKDDLKQIFAYTTVSQLGLLMCMYGLGGVTYESHGHSGPALDLDITQIANHAFYKAPLFIVAGAIGHLAGTRDLSKLRGLFARTDDHGHGFTNKAMVVTILLAGYALAAGPGTVSFQAKELFLYGAVHATQASGVFWLVVLLTIATAVCNVAIFVRLATTLLGTRFGLGGGEPEPQDVHDDDHHHHAHETGLWAALIWLPGLALVSLQYVGGVLPSVWNAVFVPLETNLHYKSFAKGVPNLWYIVTHPSLPLLLSAVAIAGGVALGLSPALRRVVLDPHNHLFPLTDRALSAAGGASMRVVQNGRLKAYVVVILASAVGAFALAVLRSDGMMPASVQSPLVFLPGLILGVVLCFSAACLPWVKDRMVRVILLGAVGMVTVSMFLVYQAPDLALTQLVVEIISVVLFVYVLRMLPALPRLPRRGLTWRVPAAVAAGGMMMWMTLVAASTPDSGLNPFNPAYPKLGEWFAQHSYQGPAGGMTGGRGGGGDNIVNVILVDFRGFDTMGEIGVLALAAMGVWILIRGRGERARRLEP